MRLGGILGNVRRDLCAVLQCKLYDMPPSFVLEPNFSCERYRLRVWHIVNACPRLGPKRSYPGMCFHFCCFAAFFLVRFLKQGDREHNA